MPPVNDDFANATELSGLMGSVVVNNVGATMEVGEENFGGAGYSVWYKYTASTDGVLSLTTMYTPLPDWDSVIGVYTGSSLATLNLETWDHDSALQVGATQPDGYGTSWAWLPVRGGVTYYIQITAYDSVTSPGTTPERSDGRLTWELTPATVVTLLPETTTGWWTADTFGNNQVIGGVGDQDATVWKTHDGETSYVRCGPGGQPFGQLENGFFNGSGVMTPVTIPSTASFLFAEMEIEARSRSGVNLTLFGELLIGQSNNIVFNYGGSEYPEFVVPAGSDWTTYKLRWVAHPAGHFSTNNFSTLSQEIGYLGDGNVGLFIDDNEDAPTDIAVDFTYVAVNVAYYLDPTAPPVNNALPNLEGVVDRGRVHFWRPRA